MKTNLIISPHNDDMIFSLGSYIQTLENVICVSPLDGIPDDEKGRVKHTRLNEEHKQACEVVCVKIISGNFLDDVYHETRDLSGLKEWFENILNSYTDADVYVPLGIHHPDHVIVRDIFIKHFRIDFFYSELPYRVRYPFLSDTLERLILSNRKLITSEPNVKKNEAVRKYKSQTDEGVLCDVLVKEKIWK